MEWSHSTPNVVLTIRVVGPKSEGDKAMAQIYAEVGEISDNTERALPTMDRANSDDVGFLKSAAGRFIPLASLASPIIFNAMIREICEVTTIVFVGRTGGAIAIGAATLGNMMCNITGYSLAYGLCSALDTLISQAYGAKSYRLTGLYAQRAAVILTICSVPVAFLWSQTHLILEYGLAIPRDTAKLAGAWARNITMGLWPSLMFIVLSKWLQGQNVVWPVVVASIAATLFNMACNYLLMSKGFGFEGVALTYALTQWFGMIFLATIIVARKRHVRLRKLSRSVFKKADWASRGSRSRGYDPLPPSPDLEGALAIVYSYCGTDVSAPLPDFSGSLSTSDSNSTADDVLERHGRNGQFSREVGQGSATEENDDPAENKEDNWPPMSVEVFEGWWQFLRLGIPGALSLLLEWGSFELAASIAARLGPVALAVHGIYASTASIFYMIPQAIALATATLVGNALGADRPEDAAKVVRDGIYVDFFYGLFAGLILLFLLRPHWGAIFTTDEDVRELVHRAMPVMFFYTLVDSTKCVTINILRSTGRPQITVWGNLLSCLAIMLPLGWILSVDLSYGLPGLWFAMSTAWLVSTIVYLFVVVRTDWSKQVVVQEPRKPEG